MLPKRVKIGGRRSDGRRLDLHWFRFVFEVRFGRAAGILVFLLVLPLGDVLVVLVVDPARPVTLGRSPSSNTSNTSATCTAATSATSTATSTGSTATSSATASSTSSTTSASGGITPEVTPSYLVPRPSGDLAAGQPSRAWGPHHRSASNLLPPRPLGGLHHITPERYAFWTPHDPTLLLPLTILRLALRASFLFFRSSPSLFVPFSFSSFDSFRFFFFSSSFTRGALYKIFKIVLIRAFCLFQVGDYSLSSRGASGWQWRNGSSERVAAEDDALRV